jgi:poly-gamma-glutamate capsule biosynthesis protein CapA/YwtB (metallophosphatase superfamily)
LILSIALQCFIFIYQKWSSKIKPIATLHQKSKILNNVRSQLKPITLSIISIFDTDHSWIDSLPSDRKRVLIATGDIIPARSVNFQATQRKDFKWPYLKVYDVLKNADVTFANLETPLTDNCEPTQEGMIFCGNAKNVEGLILSGIDIVSLANNHAGNYGQSGVDGTKKLLNDNGILVTGIGGTEIINIRGIKFAFLGYNDISSPQPGTSNADEEEIKSDILEARKQADIIVVTCHWGTEYKNQPDERQKYLGHLIIDAGADLVIGNHPHWIQPVEFYKGKLITYAHGNFIFDQEWSLETKQGVVGKYTFYDNQLVDVEYLPVLIENYGQPHFLIGIEKYKILENMKLQSEKLSINSNLLERDTGVEPVSTDWKSGVEPLN